jgi:molybdopterin-guanine dinucleotide biosynthesis protein A
MVPDAGAGAVPGLAGALIAGGRSVRMGRDKATLEIGGTPLWRRQWELLGSVCGEVAAVAPSRPAWLPEGCLFLPDQPAAEGPLGGLVAAARWASGRGASHLLALAVDLPRMTPATLREIGSSARPGIGAVPVVMGRHEPLCAVYPTGALGAMEAAVRSRDWTLQTLVARLVESGEMAGWHPADPVPFFNLNTPGQLAEATAS